MRKLLGELRRRDVLRMVALYIIGAWVAIQVAAQFFSDWGIPDSSVRYVWIAAFVCFPLAVVFSWRYDLSISGISRTPQQDPQTEDATLNRVDLAILIGLAATSCAVLLFCTMSIVQSRQAIEESRDPGVSSAPEKSVAVLAFDDLSPGGDQEWFADGITEEILNSLALLPELRVTARNSAFHFKGQSVPVPEIAARLGVRYVVEGSVRRIDDALRITYQVVRAADGFSVWSDNVDREIRDIFEVQREVALHIAEALGVVLDDEKRDAMFVLGTRNVDAYQHFLHGRRLLYDYLSGSPHETMWRAKEWFEKAIAEDPRFAAAYALRSHAYLQFLDGVLPSPVPPAEMNDSITMDWAVEQLLNDAASVVTYAEDPGLRLVGEFVSIWFSDDWRNLPRLAEQMDPATLLTAGSMLPLHHVAIALCLLHETDRAMTLAQLRIEQDPLSPFPYNEAWRAANVAGETTQAIDYLEQGLAVAGKSMWLEYHMLITHVAAGHVDEAVRLAEIPDWGPQEYHELMLAFVYAAAGREDDARRIADNFSGSDREDPGLAFLALALQMIGEYEKAERTFGVVDALPGSQVPLAAMITEFQGRVPFDISWTPKFAARLAEAGVSPEELEFPRAGRSDDDQGAEGTLN
jgi:TolB-like protein